MVNLGEESTRSNWSHYTSTWVFHSVNVCQVINEHSSVCYQIYVLKLLNNTTSNWLMRNNRFILFSIVLLIVWNRAIAQRNTFNINIWQSETISGIIRLYLSCLCKAIWHRDACILPPHFRRLKKKFLNSKQLVGEAKKIKCMWFVPSSAASWVNYF